LDLWKWGRNRPWGLNPWEHYDDDEVFLSVLKNYNSRAIRTNSYIFDGI
jgi:hypothetical protein